VRHHAWVAIGVLIVDDQLEVRVLLRRILESAGSGFVVTGEAGSGREAVEQAGLLDPAVVVLDERMPDMDGIQTAARIREQRPEQRIILFSAYVDDRLARKAQAAGINACVDKSGFRAMPETIRRVVAGDA